jgi:hypothetical protein
MRRREFIAGLGGAAVWPAVARGQVTERCAVVGFDATTIGRLDCALVG